MELQVQTLSPEKTFELGEKLAQILQGGEVICLEGELGAGKTVFAKGLGKGLEVSEHITSPTFTMIKEYSARVNQQEITYVHMDLYRLEDPEEAEFIGVKDFFRDHFVCLIEWPGIIEDILPEERLEVQIIGQGEEPRSITFSSLGSKPMADSLMRLKELL